MKIKTAFKTILFTISFLLFFVGVLHAQIYVPLENHDVKIDANITVDLYTQLSLNPTTVQIRQPSTVSILSVDSNGTRRSNRKITIYIDGDSTGISISQPPNTNSQGQTSGNVSSSVPGTYKVCAKDITEGYEILILDCELLYVVPVPAPTMVAEPQYTKGDKNIVVWNMSNSSQYQYYVEASKTSDFAVVDKSSGWISNLSHEFTNLLDNQIYFYRVKARNLYGGESGWSNVVFSVQDSTPPTIELISMSGIGSNLTTEWDGEFTINFKYRIKDNIGVQGKEFWCVAADGGKFPCKITSLESGDIWNISVKLKDLQQKGLGVLFKEYTFCVEATDLVGNVMRNCVAKLEVPEKEGITPKPEEPEKPKGPIITIPQIVDALKKITSDFFDNTIAKLEPAQLENITLTTTALNATVGLGFLLTALGYVPYFILQVILALLSLLGFRKKGNVTGYVYNSLTKEPIPQAIVRIFNENNELIWTDVTDSNGYFRTPELEDAEYYIKVTARNFVFPSKIVFGKSDFPLENVYHGDPFLTRQGKIPNFSIPMDQVEVSNFEKIIARFISRSKALWKSLHIFLFFFGLIFSIYALFVTRIWWNYIIVVAYIPATIALLISFFGKKDRYGVVKDEKGEAIEGAIVGLSEKEFDKLVSKRVTNSLGRYRFIVNKGVYNISVMNSDLKVIDTDKLTELKVEKEGGSILCPDIIVKRLEDSNKDENVEKPLKEL